MPIDLNTLLSFIALFLLIGAIVFFASRVKIKLKHGETQASVDTEREKDNVMTHKIDNSDVAIKNRTGQNVNVDEVTNSRINIS